MAYFSPLSYEQIYENMVEAYTAECSDQELDPPDLGPFSSFGPIFRSVALTLQGIQWQLVYLNALSRLATCTNIADAATFAAPWGVTPEGPEAAQGSVVFSTASAAPSQLMISPGVIVQTPDGIQFEVVADTSQSGWNAGLNAYVIAQGGTQVTATVQATVPGANGNAIATTINQIVSSAANPAPPGIAFVSNPDDFTNGAPAETLSAFIARFQEFVQGRWATDAAIIAAVAGTQQGLTYSLGDMLDGTGNDCPNYFTIFVNELNQNSGPSDELLADVQTAVQASRTPGMPYQVIAPTLLYVSGSVTLQLNPNADSATVTAAAQAAFAGYLNNIGLGNGVVFPSNVSSVTTRASYNALVALLASVPGVALMPDPPGLVINDGTEDIVVPWGTMIVAGSLTVTTQ